MTNPEIDYALADFLTGLQKRIDKHGDLPFNNHMEALGVITEEYHELVDTFRGKDKDAQREEALDLAVAAFWFLVKRKPGDKEKQTS